MKTQLIHSFSTSSLTALSNSPSSKSRPSSPSRAPRRRFLPQKEIKKRATFSVGSLDSVFFDDNDINLNGSPSSRDSGHGSEDPPDGDGDGGADVQKSSEGCFSELKRTLFRKKTLRKKLPILDWLPKYTLATLISDLIAGITVGLTVLPQGLAYASVSELPPQYGLYSGFIGPFIYIFFGSTNEVTIGPTAIIAIITLNYTHGKPPEFAVLLAFLNGIIVLLLGIFQLGYICNFISLPVFSSFTSAAALTISSTQIKSILGLNFVAKSFFGTILEAFKNIGNASIPDFILAIICALILIILQLLPHFTKPLTQKYKFAEKAIWFISVARSALVLISATLYISLTDNKHGVKVVGDVPPGLPSFQAPPFNFHHNGTEYSIMDILKEDGSALLVIPFLSIMEHITIARYLASLEGRGHRVHASQEMISTGLTNLIGSFFSSMPITGSLCGTTISFASGVKTPISGLFTGTFILLALQFLTPSFKHIPKAGLGAVIIVAVLVKVNFSILGSMWRSKRIDLIPWILTFFVSIFLGLDYGILVGILVSVIFILFYVARPKVRVKRGELQSGIEFILIDLDRSLIFPSVDYSLNAINKSAQTFSSQNKTPIVIDCHYIQYADYTFARGLRDLYMQFEKRKQPLILWKLKDSVLAVVLPILNDIPYRHCRTDRELEDMLEELERMNRSMRRKSGDVYIIVSPDNEEDPGIEDSTPNLNLQIPQNIIQRLQENRSPQDTIGKDNLNYDVFMTCTTEPAWLNEVRNKNVLRKL